MISFPMASSCSREKLDELLYVVRCIGSWGSLRTVTVGLLILIEACLFVNTTTPSTQTLNCLRLGEFWINCWIFAAFRFTCRLGLPEKFRLPALCHSSPLQTILPLQFFVSKTKTRWVLKRMWSISPTLSCRYKRLKDNNCHLMNV